MLRRWRESAKKQRDAASADFERALTREVLRTEQLRIRTLIATSALLLVALWAIDLIAPQALDQLWRGQFRAAYLSAIMTAFILFEVSVHAVIGRHLKLSHQDVPRLRRYVSALIETSMPTICVAVLRFSMLTATRWRSLIG